VISLADAGRLGQIKDLIFDTTHFRVTAFVIEADRQRVLLPFDKIQNIGPDAVTVADSSVLQGISNASPLTALPRLDEIQKLKIVDEKGTYLGTVGEVDVDTRLGSIQDIEAHKGGVLGLGGTSVSIPASAIRSIGSEVMIVSPPAGTTMNA